MNKQTHHLTDLDHMPLNPKRWRFVLNLLLKRHNWKHSRKDKGVAYKTMAERARFYAWLFEFLRDNTQKPYKLDPRSFSGRHVDFVMAHWQQAAKAGRLQPATIHTYFSFLKTFTVWIGKPNLMKPIECYFGDPKLYQRSYIALTDKSWKAAGLSMDEMIERATKIDRHAGAALRLMAAFGLRFKEACMFHPHEDVVRSDLAPPGSLEVTHHLDTHRGTKGGRERFIPVRTAAQRDAIDFAKRVAIERDASVSDRHLNLKQAIRRTRYVMERLGITRRDWGVTPHGLRHQYAGERYEELTGNVPPVAGGHAVNRKVDTATRQTIAEELGHGRTQITNAYCGKATKPPRDSSPGEHSGPAGR